MIVPGADCDSHGCGSKPMVPFWGRCTAHFSLLWDWDVHSGYDLDFDPWPNESRMGRMFFCVSCVLKVTTLTPLTPEVISRQATMNATRRLSWLPSSQAIRRADCSEPRLALS